MDNLWVDFGLLPLIGGLHGYVTNVVALRLLFRPAREVRFLGMRFQGLLHKRKGELAVSIGEVVETELLRFSDIKERLTRDDTLGPMATGLGRGVARAVGDRLPRLIPPPVRDGIVSLIEERLPREIGPMIVRFLEDEGNGEILKGKVRGMVTDRILSFDVAELEDVTKRVAGRELKSIENLGFGMGIAIGLVQGLLLTALRALGIYG